MAAAGESAPPENQPENADDDRESGPIRRSLIRATFPRVEGQVPTPRVMPEFTIQSLNNRNNRPGGSRPGGGKNRRRRPGGGGSQDHIGPMRFREHNGGNGGQGSQGGGRPFGQGPQGQGQGQGPGQGGRRRRRGGKKNG
jgi:translation initiation factor IF-2